MNISKRTNKFKNGDIIQISDKLYQNLSVSIEIQKSELGDYEYYNLKFVDISDALEFLNEFKYEDPIKIKKVK